MSEALRGYYVLDAGVSRTVNQWNALKVQAATKPLMQAIITAASGRNQPNLKVISTRIGLDTRYALVRIAVDASDWPDLQTTLIVQSVARAVVALDDQGRFVGVLEAELREAATDIGYTIPQSLNLVVIGIGYGTEAVAAAAARAYIAANKAAWEGQA